MRKPKEVSIYHWTPGYRARVPASVAGPELEKLKRRHRGKLSAEHVVEAARHPRHPLHPAFEWNNARAAHQHRLEQARGMIRSYYITVIHGNREEVVKPNIRVPGERGYRDIKAVVADPPALAAVLGEICATIRGWRRKYARVQGAPKLLDALEKVLNGK